MLSLLSKPSGTWERWGPASWGSRVGGVPQTRPAPATGPLGLPLQGESPTIPLSSSGEPHSALVSHLCPPGLQPGHGGPSPGTGPALLAYGRLPVGDTEPRSGLLPVGEGPPGPTRSPRGPVVSPRTPADARAGPAQLWLGGHGWDGWGFTSVLGGDKSHEASCSPHPSSPSEWLTRFLCLPNLDFGEGGGVCPMPPRAPEGCGEEQPGGPWASVLPVTISQRSPPRWWIPGEATPGRCDTLLPVARAQDRTPVGRHSPRPLAHRAKVAWLDTAGCSPRPDLAFQDAGGSSGSTLGSVRGQQSLGGVAWSPQSTWQE